MSEIKVKNNARVIGKTSQKKVKNNLKQNQVQSQVEIQKTEVKEKLNNFKQKNLPNQKEKTFDQISTEDYKPKSETKPKDIASAQIWVMAAVLYFILAFYDFFNHQDTFAAILNLSLGAIFTSFAWKKDKE